MFEWSVQGTSDIGEIQQGYVKLGKIRWCLLLCNTYLRNGTVLDIRSNSRMH